MSSTPQEVRQNKTKIENKQKTEGEIKIDSSLNISIIKIMLNINYLNTKLRMAQIKNKQVKPKITQFYAVYKKLIKSDMCRLKVKRWEKSYQTMLIEKSKSNYVIVKIDFREKKKERKKEITRNREEN